MSKTTTPPHIVPVILAGGNGTRLWPVSRPDAPKQFQNLAGDQCLFEETMLRVSEVKNYSPAIVVTNQEHLFLARKHVKNVKTAKNIQYICEPSARNTAPAILLAALAVAESNPNAQLLVLPSDHQISDVAAFHHAVKKASLLAYRSRRLVTFGVKPSRAETGYGYIELGEQISGDGFGLKHFHEKPSLEIATEYFLGGTHLWNSGMFLFPVQTLLTEMANSMPAMLDICRQAISNGTSTHDSLMPDAELFGKAPKISIDHAVMEKTKLGAVIPVEPIWSDVGSWQSIHEVSDHDANDNNIEGNSVVIDTKGSLVRSTGPLTTVVGLEDVIVVVEPDAVLVTKKGSDQKVKDLIVKLKQQHAKEIVAHAEVQRPWGAFTSLLSGSEYQVKQICVEKGGQLSLQSHKQRAEHWIVVSGQANVEVDGKTKVLNPNESVHIPIGAKHRLENRGDLPLELIEVQCGTYLGEDDIVRYDDVYGRSTPPTVAAE